jgi:hypothetical protein
MERSTMPGAACERRSRRFLELAAWIALFVVARGLLALSFADVFGYGEEMEKACAAKAMLDGLGVPHHELAYHYYEGGGFVVSHLDALAFLLLGQSLLAVKLVALVLGACVLTAGWVVAERFGGKVASRAFGLLFVLAPESVQKNSLLALGIHFHACLFIALILFFAGCAIAERGKRASTWLALGLASGFGLYFSYQCALTIAVVAVALLSTLRSACFSRASLAGALGSVLGLAPLLWMASHVGAEVFDIHGAELVGGKSKLDQLGAFVESVFGGRSALDWIALTALCATPLLGVLALRKSASAPMRMAARLVLTHALVFVAAYLASGFAVGRVYHYFLLHRLTPLWFLAILLASFGAAAAMRRGPRERGLALGLVGVLAGSGLVDLAGMVRDALPEHRQPDCFWRGRVEILARTKGYAYPEYLHKIESHLAGTTADKLRVFLRFVDPHPALVHEAIAIALYGDGSRTLEEIQRELADAGVTDHRGFYLGLGPMLRARLGGDIASRVRAVEGYPPDVRDALIEAVGRFGLGNLVTEDRIREEIQQGLDADLPPAYFTGLAHRAYEARGDLTVAHYFDMRTGPWMIDMERAWQAFRDVPREKWTLEAWSPDRSNAHLQHWFERPWWWP